MVVNLQEDHQRDREEYRSVSLVDFLNVYCHMAAGPPSHHVRGRLEEAGYMAAGKQGWNEFTQKDRPHDG